MSKEPESKTMPPKSEPAAPHNPFSAFDPMATWQATQATWQKMINDAYGRAQAWADEYASIEAQMYGRALQAVDTWAQLARDTIQYSQQLSIQARKLGFEAARKAGVGA
ncbi:MAG TPA: hypothetical protein VFS15_20140 [Kofleriaceae bacterium]|nr:hypothetical protein [Kofleriaceae bacterium]